VIDKLTRAEQQTLLDDSVINTRVAASQVSKRYRGIVTYSDLYQEAIEWVLKHPGTTRARLDDGRRGSTRLTGQIAKSLDLAGRRAKAFGKYALEDEAFYSRGMVEAALPAVFDQSFKVRPPADDNGYQKQHSDPSEQGGWLAMCIDVEKAWFVTSMAADWRCALAYRFGGGMRIYQVAASMAVADSTATTYIAKGVRALIDTLGGPRPGCERDCECVGTRPVKTNERATVETERAYE
jgi:hypothetical protein